MLLTSALEAGKSLLKSREQQTLDIPGQAGIIKGMSTESSPDIDAENRFKQFYKDHSDPFWRFIFKTCGDEAMADDIFQESFFKFLKADPQGLAPHQLKAYLYKIAVRLIIDHHRKIQVEQKSIANINFEERKDSDIFLSMDMDILFKQLKPKERTLLWLAYIEGYSHREISEIAGIGEKTIKVKLFRVRKKFAKILRAKGYNGYSGYNGATT